MGNVKKTREFNPNGMAASSPGGPRADAGSFSGKPWADWRGGGLQAAVCRAIGSTEESSAWRPKPRPSVSLGF